MTQSTAHPGARRITVNGVTLNVVIEGTGHWLQLDAPDRINTLLLDYLA